MRRFALVVLIAVLISASALATIPTVVVSYTIAAPDTTPPAVAPIATATITWLASATPGYLSTVAPSTYNATTGVISWTLPASSQVRFVVPKAVPPINYVVALGAGPTYNLNTLVPVGTPATAPPYMANYLLLDGSLAMTAHLPLFLESSSGHPSTVATTGQLWYDFDGAYKTLSFFDNAGVKQWAAKLSDLTGFITAESDPRLPAASTTGNVLTSNGSAWTSAPVPYATAPDYQFHNLAAWGDSLTLGLSPLLETTMPTYALTWGGVGGDTSTQIRTRMLANTASHSFTTLIWAGNNYTDPTTIKADIAAMVAALSTTNYLILSLDINSAYPLGNATHTAILALNNDLAALYTGHYYDIRAYLVAQYNPAIPQDVIDFGNDIVPTSLRATGDAIHLNSAGYQLVANQVSAFIAANLTPSANKPLSYLDVQNVFAHPPPAGAIKSTSTQPIWYADAPLLTANPPLHNYFFGGAGNTGVTGTYNTGGGGATFSVLSTGTGNVGFDNLYGLTTGSGNSAIGHGALGSIRDGNYNGAFGFEVGASQTAGAHNLLFGDWVQAPDLAGSQQLNIGNLIFGTGLYAGGTASSTPVTAWNMGIGTDAPVGFRARNFELKSASSLSLTLNTANNAEADIIFARAGSYEGAIEYHQAYRSLSFHVAGIERVRITSTGFGIGVTAPNAPTSPLQVVGLPTYANNAAALAGGLTAGAFYRTGADPDPVCVVH